jgi:hypothetical protein
MTVGDATLRAPLLGSSVLTLSAVFCRGRLARPGDIATRPFARAPLKVRHVIPAKGLP